MPSTKPLTNSPAEEQQPPSAWNSPPCGNFSVSHPRGRLLIQSDNSYVINVFTEWLPKWRKRNMRKADGKPVENRDLIEEIDRLLTGRDVEWQWVRGQSGPLLKLRTPLLKPNRSTTLLG